MVFSNNLLMGAGGQASGYKIDQSIRFNDNDSAILERDGFGQSPTSSTDCTFSVWVKRGNFGSYQVMLYGGNPAGSTAESIRFDNDEDLRIGQASSAYDLKTDQKFRDIGAWYHIVVAFDTDNGTSGDRIKVYVNNDRVTGFSTETYPSSGYSTNFTANSSSVEHVLGANSSSGPASQFFDGYMAEINFIDGQALTPASFGETNTDGVWVPKEYSGSYGNNGFFIDGRDSSDLGDDESGNGNDFASSGLAAADQVKDTPTKNWCVWNNIDTSFNDNTTSDGNLKITTASPGYTRFQLGTFGVTSGKWEWKWTPTDSLSDGGIGVDDGTSQAATGASSGAFSSQSANGVIYRSGGTKLVGGTASSYGATFAADDVIRVQLNLDAATKTIEFFKNDSSQGTINLNDNVTYFPAQFSADAGLVTVADFGQSGFSAAAGFNLLNTSNLATPTISDGSKYFQATLYNGTGSELEVDQSGNSTFQPDFVWIKNRSNAGNEHDLYDAVRGATKAIFASAANAESTQTQGLKSFDSDGFTVGTRGEVNTSGSTNVAWQWLAGNTTGSTNDDGSVDSTVTVNTTAGFSICKFNPGGNSNITFGHGLGVAPRLVMVKNLEDATNWQVLHVDQGVGNKIFLNTTAAAASDANMWQNTAPTSSVVSVGTSQTTNEQNIAYCFAAIPGYSSFGGYTGNGNADGVFVYTGFSPAFIMYKVTSTTDSWEMYDTKRRTFNPYGTQLKANLNNAETNDTRIDILSNGFKARSTNTAVNGSGATYIYIAFAEHPFGGDGIAPTTAR